MARGQGQPAVGVIATTGLDLMWYEVADLVDVVEVEPQAMWTARPEGGWDIDEPGFRWVEACGKPTLVHGIGFPVGGCDPPDPRGVALTAACTDRLGAMHWSEHLSFTQVHIDGRPVDAGFLLPPAQTHAGVEAAVDHIKTYQRAAGRPFLIETGVNYLRPRAGELPDAEFIATIAERADCAILLDLHNLMSNQRNGRQSVDEVLSGLPLERVLEIHVAGGFNLDGYYLDAHVGGPDAELLTLLETVIPQVTSVSAVIFEVVPESLITMGPEGLRVVLENLHRICDGGAVEKPLRKPSVRPRCLDDLPQAPKPWIPHEAGQSAQSRYSRAATREWERQLAAYTARIRSEPPSADPGFALLRALADHARIGQIGLARPQLLESLLVTRGVSDTEELLRDYLDSFPPKRWSTDEGDQFASWFATLHSDRPVALAPSLSVGRPGAL
jgi:uncharacterized protein